MLTVYSIRADMFKYYFVEETYAAGYGVNIFVHPMKKLTPYLYLCSDILVLIMSIFL